MYNDLSQELRDLITPLKPGEKAEYRLVRAPEKRMEVVGEHAELRVQKIEPVSFPADDMIYDPFARREVRIMVPGRSTTTSSGHPLQLEQVNTFTNGLLTVSYGEETLYTFMELWSGNRDNVNPFRKNSTTFVCERVQPAKTEKKAAELVQMGVTAAGELSSYNYAELQTVARRLRLDATQSRDSLFTQLAGLAMSEPERTANAIGERAVKLESLVDSAINEGILEWVGEQRMFILKETRANFLPIPHGDQREGLITELMEARLQRQRAMLEKLVAEKQKATAAKKK